VDTMRSVVEQPRLIPPPERALKSARDAVRRAREAAGDGKPPKWQRPWWDPPSVSDPPGTVEEVPRGRLAADPQPHGTRARYNYRQNPCRCVLCRTANARYQAAYRGRVRAEDRSASAPPGPGPATLVR